jgi:hypothetical protein
LPDLPPTHHEPLPRESPLKNGITAQQSSQ